jgi:hypothetical protein
VAGFSYEEIAEMRGLTYTRVNHIIAEANRVIREQQGREAAVRIHSSPRVARLHELEEDPPDWLRSAIGRRPAMTDDPRGAARLAKGSAGCRRLSARPRARPRSRPASGKRPSDPEAARAFDFADSAIRRAVELRQRPSDIGRAR